jgi:hypothetical protein
VWPTPEVIQRRGLRYRFSTGAAHPAGYYSLAYSLFNYVTTCKVCNTMLKASHFPITGKRCRKASREVADFASEGPLLIYPLGDIDVRPERLLTFEGVLPIPRVSRGPNRDRAEVTIAFFELDERQNLLQERARQLVFLYWARQRGPGDADAVAARARLLAPDSPHATCTRAFDALCADNPALARRMYEDAAKLL